MTDTLTDTNTDALTDRFYDTSYTQKADEERAPATAKATPGPYILRFGAVEAAFRPAEDKEYDGRPYTTTAKVEALPKLTIVGSLNADGSLDETFAGTELNRYYRLDTVPLKGRNFSTASAALKLFGLELTGDADVDTETLKNLSGLDTPVPVFVGLRGRQASGPLKGKNYMETATGRRYLDEQAFRKGDAKAKFADYAASGAGWATMGFIVDGEFTLDRPNENVEHIIVWADLEPTPFGWKAKA